MGDKKELTTKVSGEVEAVCQKKGCWMNIKNANGESMRVTFKDYAFFMPMDCAGKTAIVEGVAKIEETSIADLKEYAKDDIIKDISKFDDESDLTEINKQRKRVLYEYLTDFLVFDLIHYLKQFY